MPKARLPAPVLLALSLAPALAPLPGCAAKQMRAQAAAIAEAGGKLERETAEFAAARTAVVQLRQRNLVERRAQTAEQGQFNARTIHFWRLARDDGRGKKLALFDGVVAASEAMAAVQDRPLEWEESVLARGAALTIDRAALHRFVQQVLLLSRPGRFLDQAKFYLEYGVVVGAQVEAGLKDVQATVAGAQATRTPAEPGPAEPEPVPQRPGDRAPVDPVPPDRPDRPDRQDRPVDPPPPVRPGADRPMTGGATRGGDNR